MEFPLKAAHNCILRGCLQGQMQSGLRYGLGIMTSTDRSKILGVWKNNEREGLGVEIKASGLVNLGQFEVIKLESYFQGLNFELERED